MNVTHLLYMQADGELIVRTLLASSDRWRWSCECGVPHRHVRGTTKGAERDEVCAYPERLCDHLTLHAKQLARQRDNHWGLSEDGYVAQPVRRVRRRAPAGGRRRGRRRQPDLLGVPPRLSPPVLRRARRGE